MPASYIPVLSIAGSDSSGGAGIQADIKTISALGCYAMTAITAITAQNTLGVTAIEGISPRVVASQIDAVASDIPPLAVKLGMLYSTDILRVVCERLRAHRFEQTVVDPVMASTSGSILLKGDEVVAEVRRTLVPAAYLLTPNLVEARIIAGTDDPLRQFSEIHSMGCRNILLKGGDRSGAMKIDLLSLDWGERVIELASEAVDTANTHGTGCTLSAAIASFLAMGRTLEQSVSDAKRFIDAALLAGADVCIGSSHGPVNHFHNPVKQIIR